MLYIQLKSRFALFKTITGHWADQIYEQWGILASDLCTDDCSRQDTTRPFGAIDAHNKVANPVDVHLVVIQSSTTNTLFTHSTRVMRPP